jgi:hypothetical protein
MYLHVLTCMCLYARHSREVKAGIPCSSGAGRLGFDPRGVRCYPLSHSGQTAADSSRGPQHHSPKHAQPQGTRTHAIHWACTHVCHRPPVDDQISLCLWHGAGPLPVRENTVRDLGFTQLHSCGEYLMLILLWLDCY